MTFSAESFIDYRINSNYMSGFTGGPEFSTLVKRNRAGVSRRRPQMQMPLHRYRANYATLTAEEQAAMLDAIWVAEGQAYSFRFRDYNDWSVEDQVLGVGDGGSDPIQLVKSYTKGDRTKVREITLAYGVTMTADGVPFADFTLDELSGIVTPTGTWPDGEILKWSGRFDVCVRFASDYSPMSAPANRIRELMIELVEERHG